MINKLLFLMMGCLLSALSILHCRAQTTTETIQAAVNNWAFQYRYDSRNRMAMKKVPGADWVYLVYDNRDRLVLTQDGNQRIESAWTFTKYDALNRPVLTGIYQGEDGLDQDAMQMVVNTFYEGVETGTTDDSWYEAFEGGTGVVQGYTNQSFPTATTESDYLTVTYYDNYEFMSNWGDAYAYQNEDLSQTVNGVTYTQPDTALTLVRGQVTGVQTRNLSTKEWLQAVTYYDSRYRPIQNHTENIKGGVDRSSTLYDFVGKVLNIKNTHTLDNETNYTTARQFIYDHAGRLLETWHKVDDADSILLAKNEYNELGQLIAKKLHCEGSEDDDTDSYVDADPLVGEDGVTYADTIISDSYNGERAYIATQLIDLQAGFSVSAADGDEFTARIGYSTADAASYNKQYDPRTYQQVVDYRYNIRGWLTRINDTELTADYDSDPQDLFGMNLYYDQQAGTVANNALYNGNISAMTWSNNFMQSDSIPTARGYLFTYDPLNRLTAATYQVNNNSWAASADFHERNLTYDLNGNIQTLTRTDTSGLVIDALTYSYGSGTAVSNQLLAVSDAGESTRGFVDGATANQEYFYDANGNMTQDDNKGITYIHYNYLNLPDSIVKDNGAYLKYIYDATGVKLSQQVYDSLDNVQKTSDYLGEYFYENDTLKFINHEEGRIVMTGTASVYQYHLKDHLGNVRLTFTTVTEVDSTNATMEAAHATTEVAQYLYYNDVVTITSALFDHTGETETRTSVRLVGGTTTEQYGLAKSLSVMPGDTIRAQVYAKYLDPDTDNWTNALENIIIALARSTSATGTYVDGGAMGSASSTFVLPDYTARENDTIVGPPAYLNYLVFDRNLKFLDGGFARVSTAAREDGSTLGSTDEGIDHELLTFDKDIVIKEPGYVYIYYSNESETNVEVYFDDFTVEHMHGKVVQQEDYYPFGLTFNEYHRENTVPNMYQYNGKEKQDELGLGWLDYGARMYMPEIGRWGVVDPMSEKYFDFSPYHYVKNDPVKYIDPNGMENSIYLYVHTDEDGNRAISRKEARQIKRTANRLFKQHGLDTRVRIVKSLPDARDLDKSDALAFVANRADAVGFNSQDTGFDKPPGDAVNSGAPEVSSNTDESNASIIFLKPDDVSKNFQSEDPSFIDGTSKSDYAAGLLFHGSGHNATLDHSYVGLYGQNEVNVERGVYGLGDDRMISFMATSFVNTNKNPTFKEMMSRMTPEQRKIYTQKFNGRSRNTLRRNRRERLK